MLGLAQQCSCCLVAGGRYHIMLCHNSVHAEGEFGCKKKRREYRGAGGSKEIRTQRRQINSRERRTKKKRSWNNIIPHLVPIMVQVPPKIAAYDNGISSCDAGSWQRRLRSHNRKERTGKAANERLLAQLGVNVDMCKGIGCEWVRNQFTSILGEWRPMKHDSSEGSLPPTLYCGNHHCNNGRVVHKARQKRDCRSSRG